jgi:hypothetical protein
MKRISKEEKKKTYPTSKQDFDFFVKECIKWRNVLNLGDWDIVYYHETYDIKEKTRASTDDSPEDRCAAIYFDPIWDEQPTKYLLSRTAFHEICEVRLSDIRNMTNTEYSTEQKNTEFHKIIVLLENIVFEKYYYIDVKKK